MNAVVLLHNIDQPFVSALEAGEEPVKFQRIDADLTDAFTEEGDKEQVKGGYGDFGETVPQGDG